MGPYELELKHMRAAWRKNSNFYDPEFQFRRTGRTTGEALYIIGLAIRNHGDLVKIRNHPVAGKAATREMDMVCYLRIKEIINLLGFEFFTLDKHEMTLVYNPPGVL